MRVDKRIMPKIGKQVNRAPKVSASYSQTKRQPSKDVKHLFVAQAKLMRLMELIMLLQSARFTVEELAEHFDQCERTVYRYINLLESLEFGIEKDFNKRYFIVEHTCPLCGGELHHA